MKLSYEKIQVDQTKSVKIESYTTDSMCNMVNWHIHPEYEIVFIKNGNGTIHVGAHTEKYTDGVLIFLAPNMAHMPFGNKQHNDNIEVVIQFSENFVEEKLLLFPEFKKILRFIKTASKSIVFSKEMKEKLTDLFLLFPNQTTTEKLLNMLHILFLLSNYHQEKKPQSSSLLLEVNKNSQQRISDVFKYVNHNYAHKIESEMLAKKVGLTPNSFCRMFKSATNKNFITFLNEFRIQKAQDFFENKNTSISETMYKCGFNDSSYFCRQFKKYSGVTPSVYLKKLHNL